MGLLSRLLGRKAQPPADEPEASEVVCPHTTSVPQWDKPEDLGQEDRASRFVCSACATTFTPTEYQALRATEAERLRSIVGGSDAEEDPSDS